MAVYRQTGNGPAESEPEWPSAAARILHARLSAGLTHREVADRLKTTVHSYNDLERYDDEAFTVLSLEQLLALGKAFGVEPRVLLLGQEAAPATSTITFSDISARLADWMAREGQTVGELGDRIGWNIEPILKDSEALWNFDVEGLYALCTAVDVDWVAALPSIDGIC
jgi:hypothetical protein